MRASTSSPRTARGSLWASPAPIPASSTFRTNSAVTGRLGVVADRENHRVQVFDGNGNTRRNGTTCTVHQLIPRAGSHPRFYVGEIGGGLGSTTTCRTSGRGSASTVHKGEILGDWSPAGRLEAGQFVSPHGLAVDSRGDIYMGESRSPIGAIDTRPPVPPGLRSLQKLVKLSCRHRSRHADAEAGWRSAVSVRESRRG